MTPRQYLIRCNDEFSHVEIPDGPYRRQGVENLTSIFLEPRRDFAWLTEAVDDGTRSIEDAANTATEHSLEITSLLYATGASHTLWRHWAALASFGLLFDGRVTIANQYALLAGEWDLVRRLPRSSVTREARYFPEGLLLAISDGSDLGALPAGSLELLHVESVGDVWTSFAAALTEKNAVLVTLALHTIAELHVDLFGESWDQFYPLGYPLFDPMACGAAALARRHGLVTDELSDLDRRYLDAGLAEGDPEPLYPDERPEPSPLVDEASDA